MSHPTKQAPTPPISQTDEAVFELPDGERYRLIVRQHPLQARMSGFSLRDRYNVLI